MVNFIIKLTHFYSKNLMQMMKDLILLWLMLFFLFPPTAVIKSVMITKLKSSCNLLISGRILYSCSVRTRSVYHWVCQNNTHTHTHTRRKSNTNQQKNTTENPADWSRSKRDLRRWKYKIQQQPQTSSQVVRSLIGMW